MPHLLKSLVVLTVLAGLFLAPPAHAGKAKAKTPPAATKTEASTAGSAAPTTSPMAELKKSEATLRKTLAKEPPEWSPEKDSHDSDVRRLMAQLFDFDELGHRALIKHWDTLTPKQRADFQATFHELVERSYLRQIHGKPDYDLKFDSEEQSTGAEGPEANVSATLSTTARGKPVKVALVYKLHPKAGHWIVYDVLTDEQSLLETYRAEFNKLIAKESFDALMKRMKKKLDDKKADAESASR